MMSLMELFQVEMGLNKIPITTTDKIIKANFFLFNFAEKLFTMHQFLILHSIEIDLEVVYNVNPNIASAASRNGIS